MEIGNNSQLNNNIYSNANQALNRIATGLEINQASDDPSGLSILNNLQVQSSGLTQAIENSNSAVALTQIADSALSRQSTILDDVKEKLLQASTDTTNQQGRESILQDIQGQLRQLNDVASQTNYNGQTFLQNASDDSSASQTLQFQTSTESGNPIETTSVQSNTEGLDLEGLLNQDPATFDSATARAFLENVDNAINTVSNNRSEFAAVQNQLDSSTRNLFSQRDSTLNAASVFETNFAAETANFSKQNILAQVGAFGAAQSNNINQSIVTRLLS